MATREQERQAIGMIRKTVESLGPDSWLGFAMDGVLDDAVRNMEEDAAYSMKQRYESAQNTIYDMKMQAEAREREITRLQKEVEFYKEAVTTTEQKLKETTNRNAGLLLPKWCVNMAIEQILKEEEQIQDFMGVAADQMANYSLGLCGDENDEIKAGYLKKLKEVAEKHTSRKARLGEIIKAHDQLQKYLKELER